MNKFARKVIYWVHGLTAAFITGGTGSIAVMMVDPEAFNLGAQWKKTATVALVNGLIGAAAYLQKAPLPPLPDESENPNVQ